MAIPEIQAGLKKLGLPQPAFRVSALMVRLDEWVAAEARLPQARCRPPFPRPHLVMERPGFGQRVVPRPGSVLASPVPCHLRSRPRLFLPLVPGFGDRHRRVARGAGRGPSWSEFGDRSASGSSCNSAYPFALWMVREFLRHAGDFRAKVQPSFLQFIRPDAEIAAVGEKPCWQTPASTLMARSISSVGHARKRMGLRFECIALYTRWWRQFPDSGYEASRGHAGAHQRRFSFYLSHAKKPCFDIWEEESAYHYYTQLVHAEALGSGR